MSIPSLETPTVTGLRAALIDNNNVVQNIIVWNNDENHIAPEGLTPIVLADHTIPVCIGWVHEGNTTFIDPNPEDVQILAEPTLAELQAQIAALTTQLASLLPK